MSLDASQHASSRDYALMNIVEDKINTLSSTELKGAHIILKAIAHHLYVRHFEEQAKIDINALVKTFEELDEIAELRLIKKIEVTTYKQDRIGQTE